MYDTTRSLELNSYTKGGARLGKAAWPYCYETLASKLESGNACALPLFFCALTDGRAGIFGSGSLFERRACSIGAQA
jgi:hypothetical protein